MIKINKDALLHNNKDKASKPKINKNNLLDKGVQPACQTNRKKEAATPSKKTAKKDLGKVQMIALLMPNPMIPKNAIVYLNKDSLTNEQYTKIMDTANKLAPDNVTKINVEKVFELKFMYVVVLGNGVQMDVSKNNAIAFHELLKENK